MGAYSDIFIYVYNTSTCKRFRVSIALVMHMPLSTLCAPVSVDEPVPQCTTTMQIVGPLLSFCFAN